MAGKIISSVDNIDSAPVEMRPSLTAGKDENMELKIPEANVDHPIKEVDQSTVVSTRTLIPNKRVVSMRDVKKATMRIKSRKRLDAKAEQKTKVVNKKKTTTKKGSKKEE